SWCSASPSSCPSSWWASTCWASSRRTGSGSPGGSSCSSSSCSRRSRRRPRTRSPCSSSRSPCSRSSSSPGSCASWATGDGSGGSSQRVCGKTRPRSDPMSDDLLNDFQESLGFRLDRFQRTACQDLLEDRSVLVAAPTGAGKTVVAQFAVALARHRGVRVFYTAPIKALSNQKYAEFVREFGADEVGLLTGDTSINRSAPIVVMTTEVLRNMLYSGDDLAALGFVVLDEVHYLADRFRGPVWEEVIIHLPAHVRIVGLSATV